MEATVTIPLEQYLKLTELQKAFDKSPYVGRSIKFISLNDFIEEFNGLQESEVIQKQKEEIFGLRHELNLLNDLVTKAHKIKNYWFVKLFFKHLF